MAGLFVFDEDDKLVKKHVFEKNLEKIAQVLITGQAPEIDQMKNEFRHLTTEQPNKATETFRRNFRKYVFDSNFARKDEELNKIINEIAILKTEKEISKIERRDKLIVQTICALDDLDRILNIMSERLREWYGLHYPEMSEREHERFAEKIVKHGKRENIPGFKKSMGMHISDIDLQMLQNYAENLGKLYKMKVGITKYLETIVPEEMPNVNVLLGSLLAARLLSQAGSLERLAKLPASTIQLLGAERSLFKFLKDSKITRPPKFGILFLHPDISGSRREVQGKVARLLASRLTIAARTDFYTKRDMSKDILEDYKGKLEKIK